jgi:serine/threonine protein kinase
MHRDIKPTNIMVEDALDADNHSVKRAILIDFSHAIRFRAPAIKLDKDVATYPYRAPEIFDYSNGKCNSYDYKSDVWSMGMVLYELITGKDVRSAAHTDGESSFGEFVTNEPKMISILSKEYEKKKKDFTYTKTYFQWITAMLERDPDIRVSASEMYQDIYDFAKKNNIPIIEPKNGDDMINIPSFTPKSARMLIKEQEILNACIHMTHVYKNRLGMHFAEESLQCVLKHLIKKETISMDNYKEGTLAVCSIVDAAIYDNVYDINFCQERVSEYGITKNGLSENLRKIISKHDKDFFLLNVFSFNGMVAVDHIESRISRIKKLDMSSDVKLGIASIGDLVEDQKHKTPRRSSVQYDPKSARSKKSAHRKSQSDVESMLAGLRVT